VAGDIIKRGKPNPKDIDAGEAGGGFQRTTDAPFIEDAVKPKKEAESGRPERSEQDK
jgi:hypothetical protein